MKRVRTSTLITIILLILSLGCFCLPATFITPTRVPTHAPTIPPDSTQTTQPNGINAFGPWLLIETSVGLWAANADGSGLTQLTTVDYWHADLQAALQPNGNQVVFISSDTNDFYRYPP